MNTGYSTRPLAAKLGIKTGMHICIFHAPAGYLALLGDALRDVTLISEPIPTLDFAHYFVTQERDLIATFPTLKAAITYTGMLWISYPKGKSTLATDLTENRVRAIGLEQGLVDVKICAIDADWSGLKFVYRLRDRG